MRRFQSEQTRILRRRLFTRLVVAWAVLTAVFALAAFAFDNLASPELGDWIADHTSNWTYVPEDSLSSFTSAVERTAPLENWQFLKLEDGSDMWAVRDLSVYYALRSAKIPLVIVFYLVACVVLVLVDLSRSLRYFDELAGALGALVANRTQPVALSGELAVVQGELDAVRAQARSDELAAAAAEQRKNELVAYLAHDIKTPLTSVIGYLSLLSECEELPEETRRKYVATAYEKAERLEHLVDEFFEITRYNVQTIPVERAMVGVRLFCEQVAEEFYPGAQAREVAIEVSAPDEARFYVDADKLARALGNVMRNAVAYADAGTTVRVSARCDGDAWVLSVANRGREISPVHLQSIFEKFYREDGARSTNGGAGLGLAIAREIVSAHGGIIEAASEGGETTFTITLPLAG